MNKLDASTENIYYDDRVFKRGEIYYVDLEDVGYGSRFVTTKTRPALIIQNDTGNYFGSTLIIAPLTSQPKKDYPFQYKFSLNGRESIILFEQILTIEKQIVLEKAGELTNQQMREADIALMHSLGLNRLSFENILDIEVDSLIIKKTIQKEVKYFIIKIFFTNQTLDIHITLDNLKEYNKSINGDIDFNDLKDILDCSRGLNWLFTHNEN